MILLKCYTQYISKFGILSSGHNTGKGQISSQTQRRAMPKNGNAKECSNYHTIALIAQASKVMLKILQARLKQFVNVNFQMFKLLLENAEEPEIKLPTSAGSSKKAREFQKKTYFCFIDCAKAFDCGSQQTVENS